ncbi:hypothetical protein [Nocardiopsis lambiniae]|uniref:Uncharacterized protein n=1 Tax=Nocardiopsis lambiniae TaxID=3075539 RepID=A0ABU2M9N6_9ACTN|nr:hypothetical protein [Nocardiopsis sp. DSM 44743]MDT0329262.1 hypothetical protein [Nocardiopsis sp. DSM 44743]
MGLGGHSAAQVRESLMADRETAARLDDLLREVAAAQTALDDARAADAPVEELHERGLVLDTALTEAMRAAYARERVLIGPKGYEDRLQRRKRLARPEVRQATEVAERLLTVRETHRLHGVQRVPPQVRRA